MVLKGADRDAFLAALNEPPAPTEKLVEAFRQHRTDVVGSPPQPSGRDHDHDGRDQGVADGSDQ
jgi:hypothetical protein